MAAIMAELCEDDAPAPTREGQEEEQEEKGAAENAGAQEHAKEQEGVDSDGDVDEMCQCCASSGIAAVAERGKWLEVLFLPAALHPSLHPLSLLLWLQLLHDSILCVPNFCTTVLSNRQRRVYPPCFYLRPQSSSSQLPTARVPT